MKFAKSSAHIIALGALLSSACDLGAPLSSTESRMVMGESKPLGHGTMTAWVKLDPHGRPLALGVTLTEAAISGLPTKATPDRESPITSLEDALVFPPEARETAFEHVGVSWHPYGHEPFEHWGAPHLDFHFFLVDQLARAGMTSVGDDTLRMFKPPPSNMVPADYVDAHIAAPNQGDHWVDRLAREFHGHGLDDTFLYGSYNGEIVFWEPMISVPYWLSHPDKLVNIKLPRDYARRGVYYPTQYRMSYDPVAHTYSVAYEGLVRR